MGGDGETDRLQCPDVTGPAVAGMGVPRVIQVMDLVHFLLGKGRRRGIVDKPAVTVALAEAPGGFHVLVSVKGEEHPGKSLRTRRRFLPGRDFQKPLIFFRRGIT